MLRLGRGTYTTIVHPFLTLGLVCSSAIHRTSVDRQRAIMHFAFGVFAWEFLHVRRKIALLRTGFTSNFKPDEALQTGFYSILTLRTI